MKIVRPGYEYVLQSLNSATEGTTIQFVERREGKIVCGTSNEEVVNMLLHRFYFLQKQSHIKENTVIIALLSQVKELLKQRLERKLDQTEKKKLVKVNEEVTSVN